MKTPKNSENSRQKALTCIRPAYTMADTPEYESDEVDHLTMKHFLNSLAEISISIASRYHIERGERD
jgi:hypothetical protein